MTVVFDKQLALFRELIFLCKPPKLSELKNEEELCIPTDISDIVSSSLKKYGAKKRLLPPTANPSATPGAVPTGVRYGRQKTVTV